MTITVNHPVLGAVQFPDSATPEQINTTLLQIGKDFLPEGSSGSVFFNQLGEGLESSIEGLSNLTGLGFYEDSYEDPYEEPREPTLSLSFGGCLAVSLLKLRPPRY